jgi:two-component system response regulator YesN
MAFPSVFCVLNHPIIKEAARFMHKVLVVDDEAYVRKGLLELVEWSEMKLTIVGEARNGKEALGLIQELKPDLVITDIRMPAIDGLELIRLVNEDGRYKPLFIIISGYHDFNYARQALRYGVRDYILKPIDEEELASTLRKLSLGMAAQAARGLAEDGQLKSLMLEALAQGTADGEEAERYAAALGIQEGTSLLYVIAEVYAPPQDESVTSKTFLEAWSSIDANRALLASGEPSPGQFVLLLQATRLCKEESAFQQELEQVRMALSRRLSADVGIYCGDPVHRPTHIRDACLAANEAARHKYAEQGVIRYAGVSGKPLYVFDISPDLSGKLILQVEEGDREGYTTTAEHIFGLFREQRFSPQAVAGSLSRCLAGIVGVVNEMNGNPDCLVSLRELSQGITLANWSLDLLKRHFIGALTEADDCIAILRKESSNGGIKAVKSYIDLHYSQNISLKSIASQFYMNAVYLGRLFRKTYGVYFNDYLLEIRMKEAKRLLRQTDLRMYEIAARVGFQNADYFATQFEKLDKLTPSEYRNSLSGKE